MLLGMKSLLYRFVQCLTLVLAANSIVLPLDGAQAAERRYSTGNFDTVRIYGDFDVVIENAQGLSVRAEGDPLLINRITVRNSGKIVTIRERNVSISAPIFDDNSDKGRKRLKIYITAPAMRAVSYQGSGDLVVADLRGEKTSVMLNGDGNALIQNVESESLTSSLNGRGVLTIAGTVGTHRAAMRGYGGLDAAGLASISTNIIAEGPVFAELNASESASGLANDGARIFVVGTEQCSIRSASQSGNRNYALAPTNVRCVLADDRIDDNDIGDEVGNDNQ
jgi:hypothetical protein